MFDFEHKSEPLLPFRDFLGRLAQSTVVGLAIIAASLLVGMAGYHFTERLGWLDAFLNASMLLGGMGPVDAPKSGGGKLFAGLYALYCGLVVLVVAGIVFAPVGHRFLHRFHLEDKGGRESEGSGSRRPAR
jgi:ABC-type uncharacterized transport system permease subunit